MVQVAAAQRRASEIAGLPVEQCLALHTSEGGVLVEMFHNIFVSLPALPESDPTTPGTGEGTGASGASSSDGSYSGETSDGSYSGGTADGSPASDSGTPDGGTGDNSNTTPPPDDAQANDAGTGDGGTGNGDQNTGDGTSGNDGDVITVSELLRNDVSSGLNLLWGEAQRSLFLGPSSPSNPLRTAVESWESNQYFSSRLVDVWNAFPDAPWYQAVYITYGDAMSQSFQVDALTSGISQTSRDGQALSRAAAWYSIGKSTAFITANVAAAVVTGGSSLKPTTAAGAAGVLDDVARVKLPPVTKNYFGAGETVTPPVMPAPRIITSARELLRRAEESGPFHNFPESFDQSILNNGQRSRIQGYYAEPRPGLSQDSIRYTLRGRINGHTGEYEIFTRPSPSGSTEVIQHRFFNPD